MRGFVASLLLAGFVFAEPITVTVEPWPAPSIEEFDPADPPTDPPLAAGEAADANSRLEVLAPTFTFHYDSSANKLTITSVASATVTGWTEIRLPTDADDDLRSHEEGHDRLSEDEYTRFAKTKIEDAFRGFSGATFTGRGATPQARFADAQRQANAENDRRKQHAGAAIDRQMTVLNDKFDRLTEHGTSADVDTEAGIETAIKERDLASAAQTDAGPVTAAAALPALQFDAAAGQLAILGDLRVDETQDWTDPLRDRGLFEIEPFLFVGIRADGRIHLSDSYLRIVDHPSGGGVWLDALVYEVSFDRSSNTLQGYLDIPPDFAGGVNNSIGSPFLDRLRAGRDAGYPAFLWFAADRSPFDSFGPVGGVFTVGLAPEPSDLLLLVAGAVLLAAGCRPRKSPRLR